MKVFPLDHSSVSSSSSSPNQQTANTITSTTGQPSKQHLWWQNHPDHTSKPSMDGTVSNDGPTPTLVSLFGENDSRPTKLLKWYAYHAIKRSGLWGFLGFVIPVFIAMIAFSAYPLVIDTGGGSWYPKASGYARAQDGLSISEEVTVFNPLRLSSSKVNAVQAQQSQRVEALIIFYRSKQGSSGDLITPDKVAKIREIENNVKATTNYETVCWKSDGECATPLSITNWAYPEQNPNCSSRVYANGKGTTQVANLKQTLISAVNSSYPAYYCPEGDCNTSCSQFPDVLNAYVSKRHVQADMNSDILTSTFFFGLPLEGYENDLDREQEQLDKIGTVVRKIRDDILDKGYDEFTVRYLNGILASDYFDGLILSDMINVAISIALVFLYIWFHTKSLFLSAFGIGHVILSFPLAYLFMCVILESTKMGVLNFMSLFIILGIGADDVFIFLDAWKQSDFIVKPTPGESTFVRMFNRLVCAYRRSAWAMLITSLTTSAAFLMNLASSVPAIQVFGFFTAFMVLTNYLMVVIYFPAMVMFYEKFIKERVCGCWHPCFETDKWKEPCNWSKCCVYGKDKVEAFKLEKAQQKQAQLNEEDTCKSLDEKIDSYRLIEQFFYKRYGPFVYKRRWFWAILSIAFAILATVYAASIERSEEPAQWLPPDNPIQQAIDWQQKEFAKDPFFLRVWVVYGVSEVDRKGVNPYNPDDIGSVQFKTFDLTTSDASQTQILSHCTAIRTWDNIVITEGVADVDCPMEDFKDYVENVLNETFPVPKEQFLTKLAGYTQWYENTEGQAPDISRQDTFDERDERRYAIPNTDLLIRFEPNGTNGELKLRSMAVVFNTTIGIQSADKVQPIYDYFDAQVKGLPLIEGITTPMQTSTAWIEMELELTLYRSVVFGMGVSLAIAFAVVFITTNDMLLSLMAVFTIGLIVVSLMATIVWLGWTMSIVESICLTILVGLSVDYTIHLANSWRESSERDRQQRVREVLLEIGISIISASATSFLACLPLMNTTIVFFVKFGIFIALTVVWSTIYSFGFFMAILSIAGPRSGRNDFVFAWRLIRCKDTATPDNDNEYNNPINDEPTKPEKPVVTAITQI